MARTKVLFSFLFPLLLGVCLYRLLSAPSRVSAFSAGPPPSKTGAPGEGTCHDCHASYPINDPSGSVTIGGLPGSYIAGGDPIPFTVTVFQDGTGGIRKRWGFELTVLDANNVFAGTLVASDMTNTQIIDDGGGVDGNVRFYIEQTSAGTFYNPDGAFSATWSMTWTPPLSNVGPVTFYVAGNAADGDFTPFGDYIFTTIQTVLGPGAIVAQAFRPSGARHGPNFEWASWSRRALSSAPPRPHHAWLSLAPRRNGVAPLLAPVGARRTRS